MCTRPFDGTQEFVPDAERVTLDADHAPHISAAGTLVAALVPFLKRNRRG